MSTKDILVSDLKNLAQVVNYVIYDLKQIKKPSQKLSIKSLQEVKERMCQIADEIAKG